MNEYSLVRIFSLGKIIPQVLKLIKDMAKCETRG